MSGLALAAPLALILLPLPLLMTFLRPAAHAPAGGLRIPASLRAAMGAGDDAGVPGKRRRVSAWIAWCALVVALAGPRAPEATSALPASGRDIMLALDLSGSMVEQDFDIDGHPASRIDALKRVGSELIARRTGDRVGLVIFADHAFAAAPLSFDVDSVSRSLGEVEIGWVGRSTAIGDGLGLALKRISQSHAASRVVVLLSDGANDAGAANPMAVARLARSMGVRLYTVALGVHDTTNPEGDPDPVDFAALQKLADIGGGQALRVRTTQELADAARALETLLASEAPAPPSVIWRELWLYPALLTAVAVAAPLVPGLRARVRIARG